MRKRWGRLGGLVLALSDERRSTRVWNQGAIGEESLARHLDDVPVTGVLCFTDAQWPLLGRAFTTRGVHVLWARRPVKLLASDQPGGIDAPTMRELLASRLPPA